MTRWPEYTHSWNALKMILDGLVATFQSDQGYFPTEECEPVLSAALRLTKTFPNIREMDLLIMGNDDGDIPEALMDRFPALNSALGYLVNGELCNGQPDWSQVGRQWPLPEFWMHLDN